MPLSRRRFQRCIPALLCLGLLPSAAWADAVDDLLTKAGEAARKGELDQAEKLSSKAIDLDRKDARGYFFRGKLHELQNHHKEAIADFDSALKNDPKMAEALNSRGSERFKLGQIKESIVDFDRFLEMRPEAESRHWQRGISYYYAGRFAEGKKQFESYEKVDTNDVENAVWRYICQVRVDGVDKSRKEMLKIGEDRRIPMMRIYDLFRGSAKPDEVLADARGGQATPAQRKERLFYAYLYLGLYYESLGDAKKALEYLGLATDQKLTGHYMWDVARVHRDLRSKPRK